VGEHFRRREADGRLVFVGVEIEAKQVGFARIIPGNQDLHGSASRRMTVTFLPPGIRGCWLAGEDGLFPPLGECLSPRREHISVC
jgi:hypothetical protein